MTTQRPDTFVEKGIEYSILERKGSSLFSLLWLLNKGVTQILNASNTGPMICSYAMKDERFSLVELLVGVGETMMIEGVSPVNLDKEFAVYHGLAIATDFTGKFLAATNWLRHLHQPTGPLLYYHFVTVYECHFETGKLLKMADCSPKMEEIRQFLESDKTENQAKFEAEHEEIARLRQMLDEKMESIPLDTQTAKAIGAPERAADISKEERQALLAEMKRELEPSKARIQALYAIVHPSDSYKIRQSKIDAIFPW